MPFASPAWVILPAHIHCIWKLPSEDDDYSLRWLLLKRHFTQSVAKKIELKSGNRKREYLLWQRRFWEHAIHDESDLENHYTYIRGNAVRHGLVQNVEDWPHSSFYRAV